MPKDKRSFFERLTGTVRIDERDDELDFEEHQKHITPTHVSSKKNMMMGDKSERSDEWMEEAAEEGQLTVDVFNTTNDIVIKTIVAGVKPEDLDISISRDMVTIRGKREESREASDDDYFHRELYWGSFSRTVLLPEEIDVESAEANERHGLLTIRLPKLDKKRQTKLRVKSNQ
jgi:HSP20 family molecular chaperone IbpA